MEENVGAILVAALLAPFDHVMRSLGLVLAMVPLAWLVLVLDR